MMEAYDKYNYGANGINKKHNTVYYDRINEGVSVCTMVADHRVLRCVFKSKYGRYTQPQG